MNSESVDLIATDPPFNKGRDFHATPDSLRGQGGGKFQDRWSWERDVHEEWLDQIKDDKPSVWEVIDAANAIYMRRAKASLKLPRNQAGSDMGAFLCFMAVRLMAMHRVLKPTGSIYLHCDPTASHYLKAVMDAIFGWKNFRNQIIWRRTAGAKLSQHEPKAWGRSGDVLLFYAKTEAVRIRPFRKLTEEEANEKFEYADSRGRYFTDGLTLFRRPSQGSRPNLCYEWRGFVNSHASGWTMSKERLEEEFQKGNVVITNNGGLERRKYEADYLGAPAGGIWTDIPNLTGKDAERAGYPTQKPLALYERVLRASSNKGDMVLDPFAGCATTLVAAEKLQRRWVGIDIWEGAHELVLQRMKNVVGPLLDNVHYTREVPERTDDGETASSILPTISKRDPEPWQKLSRRQMTDHLADAQSLTEGLVTCAGCGRELEQPFMELDHIRPRSDEGVNDISNRILLCRPCNGRKSDSLTMKGLIRENRKTGWMQDETRAQRARDAAKRCHVRLVNHD